MKRNNISRYSFLSAFAKVYPHNLFLRRFIDIVLFCRVSEFAKSHGNIPFLNSSQKPTLSVNYNKKNEYTHTGIRNMSYQRKVNFINICV